MIKPNNIYFGDCYELIKQIPDKSVDLVYIDIPYQFQSHGGGGAFGPKNRSYNNDIVVSDGKRAKLKEEAERLLNIMNTTKDKDEYQKAHVQRGEILTDIDTADINTGIDYQIIDELNRVMKYIYIYIWCSKSQIPYLMNKYVNELNCNFDLLVWCKKNAVPKTNNCYLPNVEYCLFFREKNCPKRLNNGYELKSKWYISASNKQDKDLYKHPTIKPLELVKRHILHSTQENDLVLDCFAGSGTTLKACQELNRRYIGFEINEEYYKIAKDRLNNINAKGEVSLF